MVDGDKARVEAEYASLLERVRKLPAMAEAEKEEQAISFVYGNLAASTRHWAFLFEEVARIVREHRAAARGT